MIYYQSCVRWLAVCCSTIIFSFLFTPHYTLCTGPRIICLLKNMVVEADGGWGSFSCQVSWQFCGWSCIGSKQVFPGRVNLEKERNLNWGTDVFLDGWNIVSVLIAIVGILVRKLACIRIRRPLIRKDSSSFVVHTQKINLSRKMCSCAVRLKISTNNSRHIKPLFNWPFGFKKLFVTNFQFYFFN